MYLELRKLYVSKNSCIVQIIDSTFIINKYGHDHVACNKFFKNKKCNKISLITDISCIPISVLVDSGNVHDLSFVKAHMNDLIIFNNKKHHI